MQHDSPPLTVEWLLPGGRCGGRHGKGTFKARGLLPGDRFQPVDTRKRGRTLEVLEWEMVEAAPRAEHPCPVVDTCGGCDLGRLAEQKRSAQLAGLVKRALRLDLPIDAIVPETSFRSRIKLAIDGDRFGYHAPRSHTIVPIADCHVAHPAIRAILQTLSAPPPGATSIELRTDGDKVVGVLDKGRITDAHLPELAHVAVKGKTVRGDARLELEVAGLQLRASPAAFFQVNTAGNALLVDRVLQNVRRIGPERVIDLYSGIGNLTLPVAALGIPTVAVELEGQATQDLAFNAQRAGLAIEVHTAPVERFDTSVIPFDMAILDPPRAGAPGVIEKLLLHRPRAIQIVSCHVPSAARDLRPALAAGYRITDAATVDLFAGTHHIETLLLLER